MPSLFLFSLKNQRRNYFKIIIIFFLSDKISTISIFIILSFLPNKNYPKTGSKKVKNNKNQNHPTSPAPAHRSPLECLTILSWTYIGALSKSSLSLPSQHSSSSPWTPWDCPPSWTENEYLEFNILSLKERFLSLSSLSSCSLPSLSLPPSF